MQHTHTHYTQTQMNEHTMNEYHKNMTILETIMIMFYLWSITYCLEASVC